MGEADQKKLKLISDIFPNYKFDENSFEFYYKAALASKKKQTDKKEE